MTFRYSLKTQNLDFHHRQEFRRFCGDLCLDRMLIVAVQMRRKRERKREYWKRRKQVDEGCGPTATTEPVAEGSGGEC